MLNDWAAHRRATVQVPQHYAPDPDLPVLINQVKAGDVTLPFFADRVPSHAWLTVWIECFPGTTQQQIIDDLMAFYRDRQETDPVLVEMQPELKPIRFLDGSEIPGNHPFVQVLAEAAAGVLERPVIVKGAPFACDGHMFNLHSPTPVTFLGPVGGNPHSPDEFIEIEEFHRLLEIFALTAIRWCGVA
jgi:acetylornithine deacetylase